jgi:broad specificity phosphatase PhoE
MNPLHQTPFLIVIRHAPVERRYRSLCYGRADVELGEEGEAISRELAREFSKAKRAAIVHSGMQRTRFLAERIAEQIDGGATCDERLCERDFGTWELRSWDDIHAQVGNEMLGMISRPDTYRPGGGETTFEMRDRVLDWFRNLPENELTIAVTHGGPIAALRGTQQNIHVDQWASLIPQCGESVSIYTTPRCENGRGDIGEQRTNDSRRTDLLEDQRVEVHG